MDIAGTKQKVQRMVKVAEETYKKINQVIEQVEALQEDLSTTSKQVDHIEYELVEQRALIDALAREQGLDIEEILEEIEYPERLREDGEVDDEVDLSNMATSRPSVATDTDAASDTGAVTDTDATSDGRGADEQ